MNDKEIDVQREYIRLHKLFEEDGFHGMYESTKITIYEYIDKYFFKDWDKRGRCVSVNDMFTSLNIRNKNGLKEKTIENLLLYIEVIINLVEMAGIKYINEDMESYSKYSMSVYELLIENIQGLLEDLNYEINELSDKQLIIVEKDMILSAVAETKMCQIK